MDDSLQHKLVSKPRGTFHSKHILILAFIILSINILFNVLLAYNGMGYPYDTFLLSPIDRFGDFFQALDGFNIVDTWGGDHADFVYFNNFLPLSASLYFISGKLIELSGNKHVVIIIYYIIVLGVTFYMAKRAGNSVPIILLALLSYPMIFALDRGNIAMVVFLFILFSVITENIVLSTLAIAMATSIKLTPIIFLAPILLSRAISLRWIVQVVSLFIGWFVIITLVCIQVNGRFLTPTSFDPFFLFSQPLSAYAQNHVDKMAGLGYGSSLYMPMTYLTGKLRVLPWFDAYQIPLFVLAIIGCVLLIKQRFIYTLNYLIDTKNMVFISCISFVLFMPVTGDYYLLVMLIPLLAFPQSSYSLGYVIVFGLLLGAKNLPYVDFIEHVPISLQVFLNPLLLLILMFAEFNLIGFIKREISPAENSEFILIRFLRKTDGQISVLIKPFRKILITLFIVVILAGLAFFRYTLYKKEVHNKELGLPSDFDPEIYLKLNPGLQEYWESSGIHETGPALWHHAEVHYIGFGSRDGWVYRSTLQRIFYPRL